MAGLANRTPYRCRSCKKRFYVYRHGEASSKLRTPEEQRILKIRRKYKWRKSKRQLIAYAIFSVLLAAVLYEIMQHRIPTE
jgi:transposase-like protein